MSTTSLYSSVVERQSCKLKVLGSIHSGGLLMPTRAQCLRLSEHVESISGSPHVAFVIGVVLARRSLQTEHKILHTASSQFGGSNLPLANDMPHAIRTAQSACSVAASYKPPMLVTRVRLPACAYCFCCARSLSDNVWVRHVVTSKSGFPLPGFKLVCTSSDYHR